MHSSGSMNICTPGNLVPRWSGGTARSCSSGMGPRMQSQGQTSTHAVSHVPMHFLVITYAMSLERAAGVPGPSAREQMARRTGAPKCRWSHCNLGGKLHAMGDSALVLIGELLTATAD